MKKLHVVHNTWTSIATSGTIDAGLGRNCTVVVRWIRISNFLEILSTTRSSSEVMIDSLVKIEQVSEN